MELKQFADELKLGMASEIERISVEQPDAIHRTALLIACVEKYMAELKRFVLEYDFRSIPEQTEFFKDIKPHFVSHHLYYKNLFKLQIFEACHPNENRLQFYQKVLLEVQALLNRHIEFYQYVLSGADHNDEVYFSRERQTSPRVKVDEHFSTNGEEILSRIRCSEMIRLYVLKALRELENPSNGQVNSALVWTGAKTDLVELIYALHAAQVFNKKEADVKQIAETFESTFNVSLGNYYRVFQEIRLRKTGQVNFINKLKDSLIERIRDAEA